MTECGTAYWSAPELASGQKYNEVRLASAQCSPVYKVVISMCESNNNTRGLARVGVKRVFALVEKGYTSF